MPGRVRWAPLPREGHPCAADRRHDARSSAKLRETRRHLLRTTADLRRSRRWATDAPGRLRRVGRRPVPRTVPPPMQALLRLARCWPVSPPANVQASSAQKPLAPRRVPPPIARGPLDAPLTRSHRARTRRPLALGPPHGSADPTVSRHVAPSASNLTHSRRTRHHNPCGAEATSGVATGGNARGRGCLARRAPDGKPSEKPRVALTLRDAPGVATDRVLPDPSLTARPPAAGGPDRSEPPRRPAGVQSPARAEPHPLRQPSRPRGATTSRPVATRRSARITSNNVPRGLHVARPHLPCRHERRPATRHAADIPGHQRVAHASGTECS